ncbi:N-acyl homoserine lactonase family protein [Jannaschia rubra]|uniref:N-acyl homoserine lactonase n=1 Tax=Jannaschia rubra TaxID=282197 RepID=A0A0M6XN79_9RHOB|nr:N-acyl homoserine lactonase family protein [Jannaschia rubra]CTQ32388.1 N-acyl homoserine lactonase [Jannaschia rubra]SFG45569.1 Glyoxylase, beta-lactamase superfamily II [Jannaschia rubra]
MDSDWEVFALRYAEREGRVRGDSFIFDDAHDAPHPMDYFMWLLRRPGRTILVDTGYDQMEAARRGRPILLDPREALEPFGLAPDLIDTVIVTHLHYDHAGGLHLFPKATLHMQAAEMAYATGPCMCHDVLRMPYTGDHVAHAVRRLYQGRVMFHDGDGQVAEGVTVHRIGGHSRGLQAVRVRTGAGWLCLASDAAHYYENILAAKPFPIVADVTEMLDGFATLRRLASSPGLIVPGHDPLVRDLFPEHAPGCWRLSNGPTGRLPSYG